MPRLLAANYQNLPAYLTRSIDASDAAWRSGKTPLINVQQEFAA